MELHEFEEYIKNVDSSKRQKCDAWKVAIGLQAVDGLKPSSFLLDTARREIEGEITISEAEILISSYHELKKRSEGSIPQATPQVNDITLQVEGVTPQVNDITPQVGGATPQVKGVHPPSNENVVELIKVVGREQLSSKEIMNGLKLKDRKNFVQLYLNPALESHFLRYLYADKPKHPRQKYLLTVMGLMIFDELVK